MSDCEFLIIAGSEKCGTTSLYQYLYDSSLFHNSIKKETDYFRLSTDPSEGEYLISCFKYTGKSLENKFMEASPGYLTDSKLAAENIKKSGIRCQLIFCIRNPLDRLISSFLFHKSRLYLPQDLDFNAYFRMCLEYETSRVTFGIDDWFLRVPDAGRYSAHLNDFEKCIGSDFMHVFLFDDLVKNPRSVVTEVLKISGLETDFYESYSFFAANKTFGYKYSGLQILALRVNSALDLLWRRYPKFKKALLDVYIKINGNKKEDIVITDETRASVFEYYASDISDLVAKGFLSESDAMNWKAGILNS